MKFKFRLKLKFILIFLIFGAIISAVIIQYAHLSFQVSITKKYNDHAVAIAKLAASVLDGDEILEYAQTLEQSDKYLDTQKRLNNIKEQTGVYYLYVIYPYDNKKGIFIFDAALTEDQEELIREGPSELGEEVLFEDNFNSAIKVMETGKPSDYFEITDTQQGQILEKLASAYAPVFDSKGKAVAFVGVDVTITEIDDYINASSYQMTLVVEAVVLICMLVLLQVMQINVLGPIKVLKNFAEDIAEVRFGNKIKIKGHDEISEISSVFNRMADSIENHMKDIQVLNDAYYKFIPSKIFEILNKTKATEIQLGNQVNVELSILIFNVIGFQDIIKQMPSAGMFQFINKILNCVLPYVIEKEGVVETFQEAGFSAFYTGSCEASLATAVSICQKINSMNRNNSFETEKPINISISITNGPIMLGIVGHDRRLSTISISEHTKIAEYIQSIAPKYYSRVIITATAASKIERFNKIYHSRFLGFFFYSATNHLEKLYDVFDGDEDEDLRLKLQTKEAFENGVRLFCAKQFSEARLEFVNVLKVFRKDNAAREYLYRCNQYLQMEDTSQVDIYIEKA